MERLNRLYLVRHGQVIGYDRTPICGHTDLDITEVGIAQMEHLDQRLRLTDIKAIYSSDLKRSFKGARIMARHHDVPLYALPELREMYFGDWEGLPLAEVRERFPDQFKERNADLRNTRIPENGENGGELSKRVMGCLRGILEDHKGEDILIVGHGAVNRVILCDALGLDLNRMFRIQQDYGCLNIIDYLPNSTQVRLING